jgi:hypothetical protein
MSVGWITFTIPKTIMKHTTRIPLGAILLLWTISCGEAKSPEATAPEPVQAAAAPAAAVDKNRLAGTWERTDAPYQLVLSDIASDGTMKAQYLNPNPINVSKSNWVDGKDVISVFVELRDVNYPGSNYTLTYFPDRDMLIGKYFQAVEGVTYDVAFARAR